MALPRRRNSYLCRPDQLPSDRAVVILQTCAKPNQSRFVISVRMDQVLDVDIVRLGPVGLVNPWVLPSFDYHSPSFRLRAYIRLTQPDLVVPAEYM